MSEPQTINAYLSELNACLELGFRSRLRVFREVVDHFAQAVSKEVDDGATPAVAEQRAIRAFGSPQEVAASFEAGLVGALDKWLAVSTRRIRGWMASHAWGAAVIKLALMAMLSGILAAVAAVGGARHPVGALNSLILGLLWVLFLSPRAPLHGRLGAWVTPSRELGASSFAIIWIWSWTTVTTWLMMLDGDPYLDLHFLWLLGLQIVFVGSQSGAVWVSERAVGLAARRRARATEDAGRRWWEAEHPWRKALLDVWSVPLGMFALVLIYPAPLGLRGAFTVLLAVVTALLVAGLRLVRSQEEKSSYARRLENRT